ncbi:hypothetical protein LGL55_19455 [Clostridium tagluense]|uniref:CPCC family cysteine-rich protein n=1 Tax=Clostridium tagluense TaxID=360422 RepID=UPI001C0D3F7B|nr:CPCC family cysteine-rich protein [Clostridium tagluense]MBU3129945.1 hypothetical protein [Clostridium tagluense]MCB2311962.1 hypothetical protein [Clostridium tagluense]MCB2318127.1 hypothetical protein [Clostridium tagluense]MCB2323336.1 hypothetical protein [Clostridium tagluense]MCB2327911.1 hypothetical protein [Clostridium tagluense]
MNNSLYACPCCGYKTLSEKPPGTYEICKVCYWEDDGLQYGDPDCEVGANQESLRVAQKNFSSQFVDENGEVKKFPNSIDGYNYIGAKDVSKISRMPIFEMIKIFIAIEYDIAKILDLYTGVLKVNNSNFVFSYEDLNHFLTDEELNNYFVLTQRNCYENFPNDEGKFNELLNLNDEDAKIRMKEIKTIFVNEVRNKFSK